jgi:hypothetical protein
VVIDEKKIETMEWARQRGLGITEQLELSQFQVGFPDTMSMEDIYISYIAAKYGPAQISMETQA